MGHFLNLLKTIFQIHRESAFTYEERQNERLNRYLWHQMNFYIFGGIKENINIYPNTLFWVLSKSPFHFLKAWCWFTLTFNVMHPKIYLTPASWTKYQTPEHCFFFSFLMLSYLSLDKIWFYLNEAICLHTEIYRATNIYWVLW